MKKIKILDLNFKYDKLIFDNLNLEIKSKTLNTLIGPNGCGKTTLGKILSGYIKTNNIYFDDEKIKNNELKKKVIYINKHSRLNTNIKITNSKIEEYLKPLKQKRFLSKTEQSMINILISIELKPEILILDDILNNINIKKELIELIKLEKITLINITNNIEECMLMDNIIVLNNKKIIINSKTKNVLRKEKLLKENSIPLPFMLDLSNKLKFYDLIDEEITDMDEMVDMLWK